jgi:hypothetical protein
MMVENKANQTCVHNRTYQVLKALEVLAVLQILKSHRRSDEKIGKVVVP